MSKKVTSIYIGDEEAAKIAGDALNDAKKLINEGRLDDAYDLYIKTQEDLYEKHIESYGLIEALCDLYVLRGFDSSAADLYQSLLEDTNDEDQKLRVEEKSKNSFRVLSVLSDKKDSSIEEEIEKIEIAIEEMDSSPELYLKLAELYTEQGSYYDAQSALSPVLEFNNGIQNHYLSGRINIIKMDIDKKKAQENPFNIVPT